ncbi:hypothetical protein GCM10019016_098610 [Streptomyces prasinosporus]|uniref:Uncharacterized protein n=2 Tax=Streptomyces TaxID=1883 RepID=A0ABP6U7R6_9ACTN
MRGVTNTPFREGHDQGPECRERWGGRDGSDEAPAGPGWPGDPVAAEETAHLALCPASALRSTGGSAGSCAGQLDPHIRQRRDMTMAYERPTLTKVGDFQKVTGLAGKGSPDLLGGHSLL